MRLSIGAALGLAVLASTSWSSPSLHAQRTEAPREAPVPFKPGEALTYDVSHSLILTAGTVASRVLDSTVAGHSIVIEGRPVPLLAKLYHLYYRMDSLLDRRTLLSRRGSFYSETGGDKKTDVTRFDRPAHKAFYERQAEVVTKHEFPIPAGAQDGLAVLFALRSRNLRAGERFTTPVINGGSTYSAAFDVAATEAVRVPLGEFPAWNIKVAITDAQGQPVWKNVAAWISDDARRLPVKIQAELPIGNVVLALREAH